MNRRECPECGSELVLAKRPDSQPGEEIRPGPFTYLRCSICGQEFTAEQIRQKKRAKAAAL
jgi:DNA-directed RNA polymerase subunit RPC12/RpoP